MAVIDSNDSQQRIKASATSYAGIPWYRDIRVLRALAQIIFLVLAILGGIYLINNLTNNLQGSNIPVNFGIYAAPFTVALTEGPSAVAEWEWLQDRERIQQGASIAYILLFGVLGFGLYANRDGVRVVLTTIRNGLLSLMGLIGGGSRAGLSIAAYQNQLTQRTNSGPPRNEDADYVTAVLLVIGIILLIIFVTAFPPERIPGEMNRYLGSSSMTRAFITGIANTVRVVVFSLIACTLLGIFTGIALLSRNFILRTTAVVYVEIFRNTPLPVQLLFIYRMLILVLPRPQDSILSSGSFSFIPGDRELYALNTRGLYLVTPEATGQIGIFLGCFAIAFVAAFIVRRQRLKHQDATGEPAYVFRYTVGIWAAGLIIGWLLTGGWPLQGTGPFTLSYPALEGRQIAGGSLLTVAFFALFLGLTLYTGAFIAEIVRAGIQAVPYGQIEAARSQGFSNGQVLQLIVLPQALRLIVPPLGNQYVNLGKNSSLGIIVTYVDVYRVAQLANNESGQAVPFFVGLMIIYLLISLLLSVMTNFINRSTQLKTR